MTVSAVGSTTEQAIYLCTWVTTQEQPHLSLVVIDVRLTCQEKRLTFLHVVQAFERFERSFEVFSVQYHNVTLLVLGANICL